MAFSSFRLSLRRYGSNIRRAGLRLKSGEAPAQLRIPEAHLAVVGAEDGAVRAPLAAS